MGNQQGQDTSKEDIDNELLRKRRRGRCRGERVFGWYLSNFDFNSPAAKNIPPPTLVHQLEGKIITQINAGIYFTCVTEEGDYYEWTRLSEPGPDEKVVEPREPTRFDRLAGCVASIDCSRHNGTHFAAVTQTGQAVVWGRGSEGQFGDGTWTPAGLPVIAHVPGTYKPMFPFDRFWTKQPVVSLSCGDAHMIALRSDGEVFLWGYNVSRQCGPENSDIRYPRALSDFWVKPTEAGRVVQVSAGYCRNYVLTSRGHVYGWGRNREGEMGLGDTTLQTVRIPTRIDVPPARFITSGPNSAGVITFDEEIYVWGSNTAGSLGVGTNLAMVTMPTAVQLEEFDGVLKRDLSICTGNSGVVLGNGALYLAGQIGAWRGNLFHHVAELSEEYVVRVSCGTVHVLVLCGSETVSSLKNICIDLIRSRPREFASRLDLLPAELKRAILSE